MVLGNVVIYVVGAAVADGRVPRVTTCATASPRASTPFLVGDALKLCSPPPLFPVAWWVVGRRPGER